MIGTDRANPVGSRYWRPVRIGIRIGEPLDFSRYHGITNDRQVERAMTDEIMDAVRVLSEQEYVDLYASTVKKEQEAPEAA
jgi:1-acyl-sn-glycerol-3-phosphate acyltransferase